MGVKKVPLRTCVGCQIIRPKRELARVILNDKGEVVSDETGKAHGRGAYVCRIGEEIRKVNEGLKSREDFKITPNPECLEQAISKKAFDRAFGRRVTQVAIELDKKGKAV